MISWCFVTSALAQPPNSLRSIDAVWYFSSDDRPEYADPDYDHSTWEAIDVPGIFSIFDELPKIKVDLFITA